MSTLLSYTKSAFVAFTKIVSADMNQYFTDIQNRLNWAGGTDTATGLSGDNIQSNTVSGGGLNRNTKLATGTANYVCINDSSGNQTEEQYLALRRGGMAGSMAAAVSGDVPVFSGSAFAPSGPIPAGVFMPFAGTTAPSGYLMCDGSAVSRTTYSRLFGVIGSNYGSGDGSTTFNVPDMRGQFIRGANQWTQSTISYNASTNLFTATAGIVTRSGQPIQLASSGSGIPSNLSTSTTYWTVYVSSTTFKLDATSAADAVSASPTIPTAGSATIASLYLNNYVDPDHASRWSASTGGQAATDQPGVEIGDQLASHLHTYNIVGTAGGDNGHAAGGYTVGTTYFNTTSTGGNETRPKNLTANYIIKT